MISDYSFEGVKVKKISSLEEINLAHQIRIEVFVHEQECPIEVWRMVMTDIVSRKKLMKLIQNALISCCIILRILKHWELPVSGNCWEKDTKSVG